MGHTEFILDIWKKRAQTAIPSASAVPTNLDLPGLHRRENIIASGAAKMKVEYTTSLRRLRALAMKKNSLAAERKKEVRKEMDALQAHLAGLLTRIGTYTDEEKMYGFQEDGNAF